MLFSIAYEAGIPIFSIEYRLAPEFPHPIPVEDCYAGLILISTNAAAVNVDPARIAILRVRERWACSSYHHLRWRPELDPSIGEASLNLSDTRR